MPITHAAEIGAENPHQKTGAINRHENRACPIRYARNWYQKIRYKLHVRHSSEAGTGSLVPFWRQFLVCHGHKTHHQLLEQRSAVLTPRLETVKPS